MSRFLHRFELRLALVAVVALLIAQLGAVAHAYSHDESRASSTRPLGAATSHNPCNNCLAYAPLLSAAGAPHALPFSVPAERSTLPRPKAGSRFELSRLLAFRSRAPPYAS